MTAQLVTFRKSVCMKNAVYQRHARVHWQEIYFASSHKEMERYILAMPWQFNIVNIVLLLSLHFIYMHFVIA